MMRRASSILFLIAIAVSAPVGAEVPLKSKAQLQDQATHIVVGKVETVYSVRSENDDWVDTQSVAEIVVQRVEKGDRIQTGDLAYGRFWNRNWIGKGNPEPHSRGHMGPPTDELVRVYLVRKDGGYNVLLPNGFEDSPKLEPEQAKTGLAELQRTWSFVYYEEKGVVEEPGTKQFVISDDQHFQGQALTGQPASIENYYQAGLSAFNRYAIPAGAQGFTVHSLLSSGQVYNTPAFDLIKNFFASKP